MNDTLRVPDADDIVAFIAALPADAFVIASGWLEGVELSLSGAGASRALPGRVALLSLVGPKAGPLMATVAGEDGEGIFGGELVKARSAGVAVALVGGLPSHADEAPRAPTAVEPTRSGAPNTWAKVAALSRDDDDETDEAPKFGDRVHHFVFGLCDVMVVRGERMKIRDVHGAHRLREIHLSAVKVLAPTVEDGKRVFKLAKRS